MDSRPVLLITGCQKYMPSLLAAIKRFANPNYIIIGYIGKPGTPTSFDDKTRLLTLDVDDTYEGLPLKVKAAFAWVYKNFPDSPGIFKTDEDTHFKNYNKLADEIEKNSSIHYWGIAKSISKGGLMKKRVERCYTNKTLKLTKPKASYCWGPGYWVSRYAISIIIKSKAVKMGAEDVLNGYILNKHDIFPKQINLEWKAQDRKFKGTIRGGWKIGKELK